MTAPVPDLTCGFSLALGGGGARGFAHLGVVQALAERGLRPARIVGTSMGSVIGAGMAAGMTAEQMAAVAARINPWRIAHRGARFAIFDHRPLMERVVAEVGDLDIEDLEIPYAAATYDLVTGRQVAITHGPVVEALIRSCAISVVFPPVVDGDAIYADAGVWETVPVSVARGLSADPVVGVSVIAPKPGWLASGPIAWSLRAGAAALGTGPREGRLDARRYAALLAARITDPIVRDRADLLIIPNLRGVSWVRFAQWEPAWRRGYEAANRALGPVAFPSTEPTHSPADQEPVDPAPVDAESVELDPIVSPWA